MKVDLADRTLRIGTRGSPLARIQAGELRACLIERGGIDPDRIAIVVIRTAGDAVRDRPLHEVGGKGLFVREIDQALLAGTIDMAVHSMKDRPGVGPAGIGTCCFLPREDVRDAFVALDHPSLCDLPYGARVGTSSPRRRSQILRLRPDLELCGFRGNVQTRLDRLHRGEAVATVLAVAGLNRLGLAHHATLAMTPDDMLPAIGQGAVGVDARMDDTPVVMLLTALSDRQTGIQLRAERALLKGLGGSCRTAVAGLAELTPTGLRLRGEVLSPDGSDCVKGEMRGPSTQAGRLGQDLAVQLREAPGAERWLDGMS